MVFCGARMRERRKDLGMTQKELAERLGFTQCTISEYECGKSAPSIRSLPFLAVALNTSTDYLLGMTEYSDAFPFSLSMPPQEIELLQAFYSLPTLKRERAIGILIGMRDG